MTSELGTNSRGPQTVEINRVAKLLMETWYRVDSSSAVTKEPASYVANFADMAKTMIADWNARAVSDVPELVRYDHSLVGTREDKSGMLEDANGEYVRYDQVAPMLAEADMELEVAKYDAQTSEERANAAHSAMHGLAKRLEELASELHDKRSELDQIKAQEPYGYIDGPHFSTEPIEGWIPLYAAPVDQTAEIERYREALKHTRVDLVILSGNVSDAAKTCSKWDGMYERVRSWVDLIDTALSEKSPS